ncbi:MAG: endonuclease V [Deltaproteobacteria bacterium]|nr:endonuclease V [Deltaproteobacteria bacterium]
MDLKMYATISREVINKYIDLQRRLAKQIKIIPLEIKNGYVAGIDVSYKDHDIFCSVVVLSYPRLELINVYYKRDKVEFPYIPGLLSFREIPIVVKTFKEVREDIFLIFCDGQGIAHPRGFGLASHIGTVLGISTIGCAKSKLIGEYTEPPNKKGSHTPLVYQNKVVGAVLRTKNNTNPVFVSVGNYIDLKSAINYTISCSIYRIPEPTRLAHKYVTRFRDNIS